ncbi:MAG: HAMP domain-containing histidine kinase [Herpetosiphonaceae bacterium]|nr:HAMP domain-containing histidine kinase [Herpetosiphonaceae bacterium]
MRRRTLTTRLTLSYVLATLVGLVLLGGSVLGLVARSLQTQLLDALQSQTAVYAAYAATLASDTSTLGAQASAIVERFPTPPDVEVRIFATNGSLLLPKGPLGLFPSRPVRPYLVNSLVLPPVGQEEDRRYAAQPIIVNGQTIGVVEVSQSIGRIGQVLHTLLIALLLAAVVATLGALLLGTLLARTLTRPLHQLRDVAGAIAAGNLATRSPDHSSDEIGQLAAQINTMADDLQSRIQQVETLATTRQQFYRNVSHELRTPLTAIRGMAENLEDDATPDQLAALQVIQAETARLQRLVEELLQPGDQVLQPLRQRRVFDLQALVEECCTLLLPRADRSSIFMHSSFTIPSPISGDRDRVKQAILNLLDNALKWTPSRGRITIGGSQNAGMVILMISDSGPGIPPALRAQLWERGVHSSDGGQGFGLALVKEVVEAHGGSVQFTDGPGTVISVRLPLVRD